MLKNHALALVIAGLLAAGPVFADKPAWAGNKKQADREKSEGRKGKSRDRDDDRRDVRSGGHFADRHKVVVREYYVKEYSRGFCPPGLAKKRNGCMPPGQAKKWSVGRPLPREVIYYDLPPAIIVEIGPPPAGHRYVRVAADILLIAIGTGVVIDAIQDLGRM
jgi:Ni/Co efflux regulator RcnB